MSFGLKAFKLTMLINDQSRYTQFWNLYSI
jgi:hypothetical protein